MDKKRKFLFINLFTDLLCIAQRIQAEGYECFSWYAKKETKAQKAVGKGVTYVADDLFDVLNQFKDHKEELIILIDDNSWGDTCDYLVSEGWKVIGSSHFSDMAEHERDLGNELAKKVGLKVPPTWKFDDIEAGLAFIQGAEAKFPDAQFVFKANGADLAGGSKTYLSQSIKDMIWYLGWVKEDQNVHNYTIKEFELQLKIPGIEADFASWFNGDHFTSNVVLTLEQKKIHGLGAAEGCLGQIISFMPAATNPFFQEYFTKLEPILARMGHPNEWAANTIISEKDHMPYFLEWTPRFGWDSTMGELAILQYAGRSIAEFFINLAEKKPFPKDYFPQLYSCGVRLYSEGIGKNGDDVLGKPITWNPKIEENIWFYTIRKRDDGRAEITDNPFGVVVAVDKTVEGAMKKAYAIANPKSQMISTPDIFYSEVIGEHAVETIATLKDWGWVK